MFLWLAKKGSLHSSSLLWLLSKQQHNCLFHTTAIFVQTDRWIQMGRSQHPLSFSSLAVALISAIPPKMWVAMRYCLSGHREKAFQRFLLFMYMYACVLKSCPALCDTMDCNLPSSYIHGIFQARILQWVTIPSFKGSSRPRDQTCYSCIGRSILHHWYHLLLLGPS